MGFIPHDGDNVFFPKYGKKRKGVVIDADRPDGLVVVRQGYNSDWLVNPDTLQPRGKTLRAQLKIKES